eukprot:CAMPEP_0180681942 /NCGR_PEP_ID=MMETSP1037_2-20121125/70273_1 /TAXON_ID=632150 /ORGANISM="Azadinium spinosum, Strain 3D9" /LENGTH=48 /DNA_ID= /DNA_START= /DNA_END= /DNA_ORIENTATION=
MKRCAPEPTLSAPLEALLTHAIARARGSAAVAASLRRALLEVKWTEPR